MAKEKKDKIKYRPDRDLYRARVKGANGRLVDITAKSPEKLEAKIAQLENNMTLSRTGQKNMLFCDYAQTWLELHSSSIGYGTKVSYQSLLDANIFPILKDKRMLDIKPKDIQRVMASLTDKSVSIYRNALCYSGGKAATGG